METKKKPKLKIILISALAVIFALLGIFFALLSARAMTDKSYEGIKIGGLYLGSMEKSDIIRELAKAYDTKDINVTLKCEELVFDIYGSSFGLKTDIEGTADKVINYGKDGSVFARISDMIKIKRNGANLSLDMVCDYNSLQYAINESLGSKLSDVKEYSVEIGERELVVTNGKKGREVSAEDVLDKISEALVNSKIDEVIELEIKDVYPKEIDAKSFIEKYNREPKDARVEKNGDEIVIIPEVIGIKLDKKETEELIKKHKKSEESFIIPAVITMPSVSYAELEAEYTDTIIGTYSSNYSSSSENRKTNIHLASAKINSVSLNPGEVFSFNNVVGPRNEANGYKIAQVYTNNKVADGIGGGICQVSSTLYNAVVLADLEIVSRRNHSLPVSYVPLGRDATVSYGSIDFKFKNNKETPIKLEVICDGSTLTVNVYGRKKYIKDISIETQITGSVPYTTEEIKDDTMYEGERETIEEGANGTKTEAYKVVRENGVVVSRTLLAKSTYSPTSKVVRVGTKIKEAPPMEEPAFQNPAPTETSDVPEGETEPVISDEPKAESDATMQ